MIRVEPLIINREGISRYAISFEGDARYTSESYSAEVGEMLKLCNYGDYITLYSVMYVPLICVPLRVRVSYLDGRKINEKQYFFEGIFDRTTQLNLPLKRIYIWIMTVYHNLIPEFPDPGTGRLTENLGTLLESGDGADVTIVVGEEEIAAHRLILSARSPVFKKTLEADMAEKRTGRITVGECDVDTMKAVLRYIYTGSCPGLEVEGTAIKVLDLAERYQLEDLKALVAHHLSKLLTPQNAVRILLLAERYKVRDLLQTTIEHIIFFKEEVKDTAEWKDNANHPILVTCDLVRSWVGVPP